MQSTTPSLHSSEAHVWHWTAGDESDDSVALLASDELARAGAFRRAADRARFIGNSAIVRRILARYTGEPARSIRLRRSAHRKPYVADHALFFSLSHSGDESALAVTQAGEIGIDIEQRRELPEIDVLIRRYLPLGDRAIARHDRTDAFFRWWTEAEAYGKATGNGMLAETRVPRRDLRFTSLFFERPPDIIGTVVLPRCVEVVRHLNYA
jgi:4'-phosphopantetheinyl transferase